MSHRAVVGRLDTQLRGAPFCPAARSYSLFMLQRTLDVWRTIGPADRERIRDALRNTGWEDVLDYAPHHRLGKRRFRLVLEPG
jgi:hypothetical protein